MAMRENVAKIAAGQRVRLETPDGEVVWFRQDKVDPIEETQARVDELATQLAAAIDGFAQLTKRFNVALDGFGTVLAAVADGQDKIVKSTEQLELAFYSPVIPVYDNDGKLKAAQRIRRTGELK